MFSPSIIKFFALLNIILQVAFPLVATFSPLIVSAKSESHFLNSPAPPLQTRVYTLASGENINTVAAKFNTSVTDLRKLNQFRTFANGFNNLKSGDELEVPLTPLPKVHWDKASDTVTESQNEQAQKVAGMATMIGGFLSGNPNERKATSTARGMATGQVNGQLQQFLGKFGTARVQLNADDNFSLKNSQLDLLIPIYEQFDRLVFTQGSVHRTDGRSQANLGFGFRRVDGNDASGVITMQLPAGQTSKTFTFSSAIAGNYMINASYTPSTGSAITATVGEEATIEISGWKYKTTGGTGKTVSTSFRPSYIAQGDTAQILLNDTADYNSYYSFSLTGSNPAFSIDSDTVSLAPVITNASQVSAGASVTVGARNGTSQLTTSPVYALMASSGVISTGNGNTWLSWGNNASYCQKDGNNTVSMNDFKTYQSETGAIRTNNENSLWTGTSIANT
ncbi:LysM peptidoglycan-binding domain-containing protein [Enterobacter hormaechei]|nr:LysM peptidoglycan-binding domain-containing protein [Enterobacter hormaechei]